VAVFAVIFWSCLALLAWTYIGYLVLLWLLSLASRSSKPKGTSTFVSLTVVVPVFNGEATIAEKIENTIGVDYPKGKLSILVASDGSTDFTDAIVASYADRGVRLISFGHRRGKALVTNDAIATIDSEWILITDADTRLAPDCLWVMAQHFQNPRVAVVDASIVCSNERSSSVASDVGVYWRMESIMKKLETSVGCLASTFGNSTAVRRSVYRPIEATEDIDFASPLHAISQGYEVVHEPSARVYDVAQATPGAQFRARVRMVTRNFQGTLRLWPLVWSRPLVSLSIISHKLLRWLTPVLLILALLSNVLLVTERPFRQMLALQLLFYAAGLVGAIGWRAGIPIPIASSVFSFMVANAGFLVGVVNSVRGVEITQWQTGTAVTDRAPETTG